MGVCDVGGVCKGQERRLGLETRPIRKAKRWFQEKRKGFCLLDRPVGKTFEMEI